MNSCYEYAMKYTIILPFPFPIYGKYSDVPLPQILNSGEAFEWKWKISIQHFSKLTVVAGYLNVFNQIR